MTTEPDNSSQIVPNIAFVKTKFDLFNNLIFKNRLPTPLFRIRCVKSFAGQFRCTWTKIPFSEKYDTKDYILTISNFRSRTKRELEDIIIHEMIHFLIAVNGYRDSSAHGKMFREYMKKINRGFNRNITISIKSGKKQSANETTDEDDSIPSSECFKFEKSYLCLVQTTDDRELIARFAIPAIPQINNELGDWDLVQSWSWHFSTHPCFTNLPRCRTLKLYNPTEEQLKILRSGECIDFRVTPSGRFIEL